MTMYSIVCRLSFSQSRQSVSQCLDSPCQSSEFCALVDKTTDGLWSCTGMSKYYVHVYVRMMVSVCGRVTLTYGTPPNPNIHIYIPTFAVYAFTSWKIDPNQYLQSKSYIHHLPPNA